MLFLPRLLLWITGMQFILHSCDLFLADSRLTSQSRSRLWKDPNHMVFIHPEAWIATWFSLSDLPRAWASPSQPLLSPAVQWGLEGKAESWWLTFMALRAEGRTVCLVAQFSLQSRWEPYQGEYKCFFWKVIILL